MKKITIGLSAHTPFNLFSSVIKFLLKTPYSHAYIKFYDERIDRTLVYQASGLTVNLMNIETFNSDENVFKEYTIEIPEDIYYKSLTFCYDQLGKPYDMKMIVNIFFYILFSIKLFRGDGTKAYVCSELVGYVLKMIGILPAEYNLDFYTPRDVFVTMEKLKN